MRIPVELTYEMVEKRHPQELKKLIKKLRASSSKQKDADPKLMEFEYSYAMSCGVSYNGKEFFDHIAAGTLPKVERPSTVEDKVKDWLERATGVGLNAKIGRWSGHEFVPNPPELEEAFRRDAESEVAKEARINAMSDTERQQETDEIVKELMTFGGFVGFRTFGK